MSYGELKIDTITFTSAGVDTSISVSGLVQNPTFTGNITTTGTISGDVIRGNTVSGATVTGDAGEFGTITGNTAGFTTVTGTTVTGTTANFVTVSGTTVTGDTGQFTNITGVNIVGTTQVSGATVTGNIGLFTTITGGIHTLTSGVFASGTAANPSITFVDDLDTGLFTGAANTVSIGANGGAVLTVSGTNVGIGTTTPDDVLDVRSGAAGFSQFVHASGQGGIRIAGTGASSSANLVFSNNHTSGISDEFTIQMDGATDDLLFITGGTGGAERVRFTEEGRVGVGVTNPDVQLSLTGSTNGISASLRLNNTDTGGRNFLITSRNDGGLRISDDTAGSERARIDSSGRLLVGTTSSSASTKAVLQGNSSSSTGPASLFISAGTSTPSSGASIGLLRFSDSNHAQSAEITAFRDGGTWTSGSSQPTGLSFSTTADGASSPTERMRIDSSGRLLIGTTTEVSVVTRSIDLVGTGASTSQPVINLALFAGTATATARPQLNFYRTRGTQATPTANSSGDLLAQINFNAYDGNSTDSYAAGRIECFADAAHGVTDTPGRLSFSTTADGASTPTENMRLSSTGALGITPNGVSNIGSGYGVVVGTPAGGSGGIFAVSNQNVFGTGGSSGYILARGIAAGSGSTAVDTGISINASIGRSALIVAARNTGAGTSTDSALYFVQFYQSGNNAPAVTFVAGDSNFVTFGVSGSNTLTANGNSGNWTLGAITSP